MLGRDVEDVLRVMLGGDCGLTVTLMFRGVTLLRE